MNARPDRLPDGVGRSVVPTKGLGEPKRVRCIVPLQTGDTCNSATLTGWCAQTDSRLLYGGGPDGARTRPFRSTKNLRSCPAKSSMGHSVGCDVADRVAQPSAEPDRPAAQRTLKMRPCRCERFCGRSSGTIVVQSSMRVNMVTGMSIRRDDLCRKRA